MEFALARVVRRFRGSALLLVMLGASSLMAAACAEEAPAIHRNFGNGEKAVDGTDPAKEGTPPTGNDGDVNNPQAPTNQGPQHNASGFAAIAPLLETHCAECHHPGTWLDLQSGADVSTAAKIVTAIEAGTMPPAPRTPIAAADLASIKAWRDGTAPAASPPASAPSTIAVTQLLDATTLGTYKAALPKVGWPRLGKILQSPSTLYWDKAAIPPVYQDTVGNGADIPFGARLNNAGKSLIVQEGKKLFNADGSTWSFPFGHTAGADESTNAFIVNFMSLPEEGGALLPIAYRIETATTGGLPIKRWNWSFPKGTIVGEIIMLRDGASLVTSEIRVRERFADSWATNAFRPFPTASTLSAAIKQKRPAWQGTAALKTMVDALDNAGTLTAKSLQSPSFINIVSLQCSVDAPLPDSGDDALVRDLLKTTTFVGAYGTAWKTSGGQKAFGATGPNAGLSVVPNKFDLGLLEVRESTCSKCHNQGGYFIGDLVDQAILYGDVWGVDRIFSFHPFEPSRIDASGNENRVVRTSLLPIVKLYNAAQHPATRYSFYRPAPP